jgi:F-type H+-transporting ATPase subunit epsilon
MHLSILRAGGLLLNMHALKIIAQALDGSFALLPRHTDFVAPLVPGVLLATGTEGREAIIGTDEGVLVKTGYNVRVAVRRAVIGDDLGSLRRLVELEFRTADAREVSARRALANLEAGIVRRFIELEEKT